MWANRDSDWYLPLFGVLLAASVIGDLTAVDTPKSQVTISSSFLAITTAAVFLGETPAAVIGVTTIVAGWLRFRYAPPTLLINVVTYAWFPLLAGLAFHGLTRGAGIGQMDALFYLLVLVLFLIGLAIDFVLIAGYFSYLEGSRFVTMVRRALIPLLPAELVSALLAVGVAYVYVQAGLGAVAMFGVVALVFQYLIGALLVSQERADELELRAKQLAGFQVGAAERPPADPRPARPDDGPPQRGGGPVLARDRRGGGSVAVRSKSSRTRPGCSTTSASSCSPIGS